MKFIVQPGRHAQQYVASPSRWKGLPHSKLTIRTSGAMMPAMEIDSYWAPGRSPRPGPRVSRTCGPDSLRRPGISRDPPLPMLWQHGPDHWREAAQHRVAGKSEDPGYLCRKQPRSRRRHGHEGGGGCGQFLQPAVPDLHPHIPETEQPRRGLPTKAVRFLPQRPTKEAGERCSSLFPLLCSYNPLPRSVAATDVGQMADKAVAGWGKPITRTPARKQPTRAAVTRNQSQCIGLSAPAAALATMRRLLSGSGEGALR